MIEAQRRTVFEGEMAKHLVYDLLMRHAEALLSIIFRTSMTTFLGWLHKQAPNNAMVPEKTSSLAAPAALSLKKRTACTIYFKPRRLRLGSCGSNPRADSGSRLGSHPAAIGPMHGVVRQGRGRASHATLISSQASHHRPSRPTQSLVFW